jgi:hypothetical protein
VRGAPAMEGSVASPKVERGTKMPSARLTMTPTKARQSDH